MSAPARNRLKCFYETVGTRAETDGFSILLDGKTVRTPAGEELRLPTADLADALASEWRAQAGFIDIASMHLTRLANVAIDRTPSTRDALCDEMVRYCTTDLVCHLSEYPEALASRQDNAWRPIRDWAGEALGIVLLPTTGLAHIPQPPASLAAARQHALALTDFELTGLVYGAGLFGSALLAFAVHGGRLCAEEAFMASRIDDDWQAERWGQDEEAEAAAMARRVEAKALNVWFSALRATSSPVSVGQGDDREPRRGGQTCDG